LFTRFPLIRSLARRRSAFRQKLQARIKQGGISCVKQLLFFKAIKIVTMLQGQKKQAPQRLFLPQRQDDPVSA
jgi:hypothetical protein